MPVAGLRKVKNRIRWLAAIVSIAIALLEPMPSLEPLRSLEDYVDNHVQEFNDWARGASATVVIVELSSKAHAWPIDRSVLARAASNAVLGKAAVVGIDVDMDYRRSESGDSTLLDLLKREPRIVPLRMVSSKIEDGDATGFVFDANGAFLGLRCDADISSPTAPFALRVLVASGIPLQSLLRNCRDSVLRPYVRQREAGIAVVNLDALLGDRSLHSFEGKVVIMGLIDKNLGLHAYSGVHSSTFLNASVVESGISDAWRRPSLGVTGAIYGLLTICLWSAAMHARSKRLLTLYCLALALGALLLRLLTWFPIIPAFALVMVNVALGPMQERPSDAVIS